MKTNTRKRDLFNSRTVNAIGVLLSVTLLNSTPAFADVRDQAKRVYDRIAGVPPTETQLSDMVTAIEDSGSDEEAFIQAAIDYPMDNKNFYNVTLKNWITPWTNEAQTVFAPLNDFTATAIGIIRDDANFRSVLYDDVIYVARAAEGFTSYSNSNNTHYEEMENSDADLQTVLERRAQSAVTGLPSTATAGVMTTRAAAHAFFVAGTNRAMFRFTLLNFLCNDLEQFKDTTRP